MAAANNKKSNNYQIPRTSRKIEKWSDIISQSNIDLSKSINYVTSKQIKQITNEDPRLMAKMDKIENLPKIFRENSLFPLPVSRMEYAIVKGIGYHKLEAISDVKPITHVTQVPFPASITKDNSLYLQ